MAVYYELRWSMIGSPDSFVILRWQERTSSWYVINNIDGDSLEPLASLLARDPSTLNQPGGLWYNYQGLHDPNIVFPSLQSFQDHYASFEWGTHYQILQYYHSQAAFSSYTTLDPVADAAWNTPSTLDHLVKVRKKYYDGNPQIRSINVTDSDTNPVGRLKIEDNFFGESYEGAMVAPYCVRPEMLEIIGESIKLNRNVWIRDVSNNIVRWV